MLFNPLRELVCLAELAGISWQYNSNFPSSFPNALSSLYLQSGINDGADFKAVSDAMKVIGFTPDEIQTVYKILATILHLVKHRNI